MEYDRGAVVNGPDLFADHDYRPYVCLSDETPSFTDEEDLFAAGTTIQRDAAIQLTDADFESGGLPRKTYINPWTVVSIRHADIQYEKGLLSSSVVEEVAEAAAGYLGVR